MLFFRRSAQRVPMDEKCRYARATCRSMTSCSVRKRFNDKVKVSTLGRRNAIDEALLVVAIGVSRGENTPLAIGNQRGCACGRRYVFTEQRELALSSMGHGLRLGRDFRRSDPECAFVACDFPCHVSGSEQVRVTCQGHAYITLLESRGRKGKWTPSGR